MKRLAAAVAIATSLMTASSGAQESPADRAVNEAKQYSGSTINFVFPAGLGALDPKTFSGPKWTELTGINVNVIEVPTNELFTKILQEHRAGTGAYDVVSIVPAWLADLSAAGALENLEPYIAKYEYGGALEDIEPAYRDMMYWNGAAYSLIDDGDVLMLYYRKDLFADPAHQAAYKEKTGADLAPPKTWDEFDRIAAYFTEAMAPGLHGAAIQRNPGQLHYYFLEWFRNAGGRLFEPDSMKATINNEIGVSVLTQMLAQHAFMPSGAAAWGPNEVMAEWLAGRLAMATWWPPLGRWSAGFGTDQQAMAFVPPSQVAGKVGYAPMPGGAPALALGGAMGLSPGSQNKEAAYLFIQWMNSPETSLQRVMLPISLRDPFRKSHFESEEYRSLWPDAGEYLDALVVGANSGLIDLSVRNTFEYSDALIRGLQKALGGTDPKAVLDEVAAEWDSITERTGIDEQRAAYQDWAQKPAAYPGN